MTIGAFELAQGVGSIAELPAGHRVAILLAFGYPAAGSTHGGVPRVPLEDLVHEDRW